MVNRIWRYHFGRGIVETLDNFGKVGARPTHPELLDWLAKQFIKKDWSLKEMHRLMMTSATYRQSSRVSSKHQEVDPDNRWLSHMPLQRMDAESLRDTVLLVSGRLNETRYGRPDPVEVRKDGLVTGKQTGNGWRRSIYLLQKRTEPSTLLTTFDLPTLNPNCIQRAESTVALQALHLSNDAMIRQLATDFALRVRREAGIDSAQRVERVYLLALSRLPTGEEREIGLNALKQLKSTIGRPQQTEKSSSVDVSDHSPTDPAQEALAIYCHTIFNSSAFLYID